MDYLKNEQCYLDLYDLYTIKECLRIKSQLTKPVKSLQKIKASEKEKLRAILTAHNLLLYHAKGERYKNKQQIIGKWMDDDRLRDERLANTSLPSGIFCDYCEESLELETKHLHDIDIDKLRVLFFFKCPECHKKKAVYEDGEEFKYDRTCPKCKTGEIKSKFSRKGNVITTIDTCTECNYKEKEIMDLDKNRRKREEKEKQDKQLLRKFRSQYCLSDKEGQEYVGEVERLKALMSLMKEQEEKQADPRYHKAKKLKRITVVKLEKILKKALEKEKYINLQFDKPIIDKFVIIPFTAQDANNKREKYDSKNALRRLIKKTLEKTNWRLTSEGIDYRLGYLSGKLKGYENEDDLIKIVRR